MRFVWTTPGEIVFGAGCRSGLVERLRHFGENPLVVLGSGARQDWLPEALAEGGFCPKIWRVCGEPDVEAAQAGAALAIEAGCRWVIACGGGSVLDAGKAVAALMTNGGDPRPFLEVIGGARPLEHDAAPLVAVPTTAGTGSEATRNAVLRSGEHGVKVSLRHRSMVPALAVVDPELTHSLPAAATAATGMDALTQLLEAWVCRRANPMTDALCAGGIPLAARALPRAVRDGADPSARADMALAALWSGLALANAGLGAVHGFAAAIGGRVGAPHGAVCAALLPAVWRVNLEAARRLSLEPVLERFRQAAFWLTGKPDAAAEAGVEFLQGLAAAVAIPALSHLGVTRDLFPDLSAAARNASSMKPNPVDLSDDELHRCLELAF